MTEKTLRQLNDLDHIRTNNSGIINALLENYPNAFEDSTFDIAGQNVLFLKQYDSMPAYIISPDHGILEVRVDSQKLEESGAEINEETLQLIKIDIDSLLTEYNLTDINGRPQFSFEYEQSEYVSMRVKPFDYSDTSFNLLRLSLVSQEHRNKIEKERLEKTQAEFVLKKLNIFPTSEPTTK